MIPLPTTTVALLAPKQPGEAPTESEDWGVGGAPDTDFVEVAAGIRAHLAPGSTGVANYSDADAAGSTETLRYKLLVDPCALTTDMRIRDETTDLTYEVAWVMPRPEPLAHLVASVTRSTGTS